ncbi:uncharacterized protein METZ01_LOCUS26053 [marine metagenome]|uniref:Uncharacterized protein n=1 Tax=marine metagenome TaxID=408172 RepID=A0A381Q4F1_9ZZZZ
MFDLYNPNVFCRKKRAFIHPYPHD